MYPYFREEPLRGLYILSEYPLPQRGTITWFVHPVYECTYIPYFREETLRVVSALWLRRPSEPDRVLEQPPSIGFNVHVPNSAFCTPNGRLQPPASERLPVGLK